MDETTSSEQLLFGNETAVAPGPSSFMWMFFTSALYIFNEYFIIPCLMFGFVGNVLSMVIFFQRRHHDKASAGYLGPLAFFDFWNVCIGIYYWLVQGAKNVTQGSFYLDSYGDTPVGCWLAWFFLMFGMYMSGWIIVAFSFERCLVVWFPLKMTTILTPKTRRNGVLSLLGCMPMYFVVTVTTPGFFPGDKGASTTRWCPIKDGTPVFFVGLFWFVCSGLSSGLPCICVLTLNIFILLGVRRSGRALDSQSKTAYKNEMRCLKNLLLVSTFYLIFMTPFSVFWSWSNVGQNLGIIYDLTLYSLQWASLNYCINPILYCFSLPYYREDAAKILTCGLTTMWDDKMARSKSVSKTSSVVK